jgi:hypothetical protein
MTDAPRKPFWKRKRWIAATMLWLALMYPASLGPVIYVGSRWSMPQGSAELLQQVYAPLDWLYDRLPSRAAMAYQRYIDSFHKYGDLRVGQPSL